MPGPLARFLRLGFAVMVRSNLRGVWLRGELPPEGFVWAANHHSWWDAFVALAALETERREAGLLMDPANLARFGFLRGLGALGTNELRAGLREIRAGRALIVFPEGELRPPGPLGPLGRGAGWLARHARAPLVAVAVRLALRGQQAAEAYLDAAPATPETLQTSLSARLAALDAELLRADPRAPLPGFKRVVAGRPSWDERLERWGRLWPS